MFFRVLESVLRKMESLLLTGKIQKEILEFTNAMKEMLKGKMDEEELRSMVECVFVPIENEIQRFALIEKKILLEAINPIASQSVSISVMERSVDSIVRLAESAIDDCLALTEGTELETLSAQIEFALSKCVSTMTSSLKTIRAKALSESSTEDVSMLSSVLQLLKLAMAIERNVDLVAKKFNEAKIDVQNRLRNSSPFDHVQTRLVRFCCLQDSIVSADCRNFNPKRGACVHFWKEKIGKEKSRFSKPSMVSEQLLKHLFSIRLCTNRVNSSKVDNPFSFFSNTGHRFQSNGRVEKRIDRIGPYIRTAAFQCISSPLRFGV